MNKLSVKVNEYIIVWIKIPSAPINKDTMSKNNIKNFKLLKFFFRHRMTGPVLKYYF